MRRATAPSATRAFVLVCLLFIYELTFFFYLRAYVELILQVLASHVAGADALVLKEEDDTALGSTDKFLSSQLRYTTDAHGQDICLLQSGDTEIGVMMGWERGISAFGFLEIMCVAMLKGGSKLKCRKRCAGYVVTIPTRRQA